MARRHFQVEQAARCVPFTTKKIARLVRAMVTRSVQWQLLERQADALQKRALAPMARRHFQVERLERSATRKVKKIARPVLLDFI